ncbi:NAD(P)-binding domain containing protein [Trema orientale]|uniref:NAD(P)-binding domain containing protein n=1 Tax=Trema orientale TaxID=63057 RepID=A0A2P5AHG4_TREOI|nr:NAD(P)-binding domain containing protein [Trema orientale]
MATIESHKATNNGHVAAIFGVTGVVGKELARRLTSASSKSEWKKVYGIARNPDRVNPINRSNYHFIQCDLLNRFEAHQRLSSLRDVTHIFWVTWASQYGYDSRECCEQNKAMMVNALNAVLPKAKSSLKHFSLQTGLKHYVCLQGPFNNEESKVRFYSEESPRVSSENGNFYYDLEDLLKERLRNKVAWTIQRPGLIMGSSCRSVYNIMGCLGVYGTICRHLKLPFVFGGTKKCWEEFVLDGSDVRLVAEQHIWAATNKDVYDTTNGQAFNCLNGPGFTWKEIWPILGKNFGAQVPNDMFSGELCYTRAMADKGKVWEEIVEKEGLVQTKMEDLANWEFLDSVFRCPFRLLGSRDKVDRFGFTLRYKTLDSILYWLDLMRDDKIIP